MHFVGNETVSMNLQDSSFSGKNYTDNEGMCSYLSLVRNRRELQRIVKNAAVNLIFMLTAIFKENVTSIFRGVKYLKEDQASSLRIQSLIVPHHLTSTYMRIAIFQQVGNVH